jgi:integrase/recombinase XerD
MPKASCRSLFACQKLKEPKKVLATFTTEQIKAIIGLSLKGLNDQRIHTLACLLLDARLRISGALQLRRKDVDLDNLLIKVDGKGAKQRVTPISLEMRKVFFKWMRRQDVAGAEDLVFATRVDVSGWHEGEPSLR